MGSDSSPVSRALLALELVQGSPGISAARLAERLGVSERAARRYVSLLREAGIPVESVRGPYGGYRVGRGLRLPPVVFRADEALALVMAVLDGHHDASDPAGTVGGAIGTIIRALPGPVAAQAEAVRRTVTPMPDRSAVRPDPATTATLVHACSDGRAIRLDYRPESGRGLSVEVEPWSVVVRHGRWYLLCRSVEHQAVRAYRVDRVRAVELLTGTVVLPPGLDPAAVLEEHLAVGWAHEAEVLVDAGPEEVRSWLPRTLGRLEPTEDGGTRLVGSTNNPRWYVHELARTPMRYRVVGSAPLREAARALGRELLAAAGDEA
ncbi:WYL domain-containing protein [Actinotalea sp. BY-33]|uniref:WYL domain-containing protein n=1 Tax=Actinotalea soli TaxID=2819234 RepID=A0A939LQT1_9CELL|nr:WYL domain-containing protein [Actinotalea soli]MBO1752796.1 WYL domain-containing protein [Actinotalea soli]